MSVIKAIDRAYDIARKRKWDTVYWAIDLHGVCLKSTYQDGVHEFYSKEAIAALQLISSLPETKIIIWTSSHSSQYDQIRALFAARDINVHYINENPEVPSTSLSSFNSKFYFSVLLDDKAGFDQDTDWEHIIEWFSTKYEAL
jgi:hypothetical protein